MTLNVTGHFKQISDKKIKKHPLLSSQKNKLDDCSSAISQCVKSFASEHDDFGRKHTIFHHVQRRMVVMIINMKRARKTLMGAAIAIFHHQIPKLVTVSSCSYPSSIEEMTRFGLKGETEGNPSASGSSMHSENTRPFRRKRKSSNPSCTVPKYLKLPKRSKL